MDALKATLQFDLADGRAINAIDAASALISLATALQNAMAIIDPADSFSVDLVGDEAGCLRLHTDAPYQRTGKSE